MRVCGMLPWPGIMGMRRSVARVGGGAEEVRAQMFDCVIQKLGFALPSYVSKILLPCVTGVLEARRGTSPFQRRKLKCGVEAPCPSLS